MLHVIHHKKLTRFLLCNLFKELVILTLFLLSLVRLCDFNCSVQTFLGFMKEKAPQTILTDHNMWLKEAIAIEMIETKHAFAFGISLQSFQIGFLYYSDHIMMIGKLSFIGSIIWNWWKILKGDGGKW